MSERAKWIILLVGDLIVLVLVTVVGFASHGTLSSAGLRIPATFFPVVLSWFVVAPVLGAYDLQRIRGWREIWRPFYAMILASPLAAVLRGLWLNMPVIPTFVIVLGGISALAILGWRVLFKLLFLREMPSSG